MAPITTLFYEFSDIINFGLFGQETLVFLGYLFLLRKRVLF